MNADDILQQAEQYSSHTGRTLSTIGSYAVRDGKFFERLKGGGDCTTKTVEKVIKWFSANWPDDLEWPCHIPRPRVADREAV